MSAKSATLLRSVLITVVTSMTTTTTTTLMMHPSTTRLQICFKNGRMNIFVGIFVCRNEEKEMPGLEPPTPPHNS